MCLQKPRQDLCNAQTIVFAAQTVTVFSPNGGVIMMMIAKMLGPMESVPMRKIVVSGCHKWRTEVFKKQF